MSTNAQEQPQSLRVIDGNNMPAIYAEAAAAMRKDSPRLAERIGGFSDAERTELAGVLRVQVEPQQMADRLIALVAEGGSGSISRLAVTSDALQEWLAAIAYEADYQVDEAIGD